MDFSDVNKRKYRRKKGQKPLRGVQTALILFVLIAAFFAVFKISDAVRERQIETQIKKAEQIVGAEENKIKTSVHLPGSLNSGYYILLRLPQESDGFEGKEAWTDLPSNIEDMSKKLYLHNQIIMEKQPNDRMYPASMTKILTAITVLENISELNRKVTISDKHFRYYYADGATIAGYRAGDTVSLLDLLYGLMLLSGSECASVLAEETAGGEEAFAELMNTKAAEIGMTSSHFTNPVGLHHPENYSTVSDIALLLDYALQNRTFAEIFMSKQYTAAPVGSHPAGLEMKNHVFRDEEEQSAEAGSVLGGKTGFVDESGQCFAGLFLKDDVRFILVSAAAMPQNSRTQSLHLDDMWTVLKSIEVFSTTN